MLVPGLVRSASLSAALENHQSLLDRIVFWCILDVEAVSFSLLVLVLHECNLSHG